MLSHCEVPLVGPGVSLTEHPLLPVRRRAPGLCRGPHRPFLIPLQTPGLLHPLPPCYRPRGATSEAHEQRPHCVSGGDAQLWHHTRWVRMGQSLNSSQVVPLPVGAQPGNGEPVLRWCRNFAVTRLCPPSPSAPEFLAPSLTPGETGYRGQWELIQLRCSAGDHRNTDPHPSCIQRRAPYAPGPMLTPVLRQGYGGGQQLPQQQQGQGGGSSHGCSCTLRTGSGGRASSWARRGWWWASPEHQFPPTPALAQTPIQPPWVGGGFCVAPLPAEPARKKKPSGIFGASLWLKLSWDR